MKNQKIIEPVGFFVASIIGVFSLFLFYGDTSSFWGSLSAALMAAGWAWMTYIILRWFLLAIKK